MKILSFLSVLSTALLVSSCTSNSGNKVNQSTATTADTAKPECYRAVFDRDTAFLNLSDPGTATVKGNLLIQYGNNPKNDGSFEGKFSGDTLLAIYTYTVGTYKDRIIKNPIALLRKNDSLILGVGEIETSAGRSYFKPGAPINFDKGRFRFAKTECKSTK